MSPEMIRRLVMLAYDQGWRDACNDHLKQGRDPDYPIGRGGRGSVEAVLMELDPRDVLGLRA